MNDTIQIESLAGEDLRFSVDGYLPHFELDPDGVLHALESGKELAYFPLGEDARWVEPLDAYTTAFAFLARCGLYDQFAVCNSHGGTSIRAELVEPKQGGPLIKLYQHKTGGGRGRLLGSFTLAQLEVDVTTTLLLRHGWRIRPDEIQPLAARLRSTLAERRQPFPVLRPAHPALIARPRSRPSGLAGRLAFRKRPLTLS